MNDYNKYVIIKGKIYPCYPKYHQKQLENNEVYKLSECINILKARK